MKTLKLKVTNKIAESKTEKFAIIILFLYIFLIVSNNLWSIGISSQIQDLLIVEPVNLLSKDKILKELLQKNSRGEELPVLWVNPFDDENVQFYYVSKNKIKTIKLKLNKIHNDLVRYTHAKGYNSANHVFASIGAIVSKDIYFRADKKNDFKKLQKKKNTVEREFINGYLTYDNKFIDFRSSLKKAPFIKDVIEYNKKKFNEPQMKIAYLYEEAGETEIASKVGNTKQGGLLPYFHSEQFLRIFLEEAPNLFVSLLENKGKIIKERKIYAIVLNLCSTNFVCGRCLKMFKILHTREKFLKGIETALKNSGYVISKKGLRFIPIVSALQEYKGGCKPQSEKYPKGVGINIKLIHDLGLLVESKRDTSC